MEAQRRYEEARRGERRGLAGPRIALGRPLGPEVDHEPTLTEQYRARWLGGWPGEEMEPAFKEWVSEQAGYTPEARQLFSPIPLDVRWGGGGGGGWWPPIPLARPRGKIGLFWSEATTAVHEYAHAFYQGPMKDRPYRDRFVNAVMQLAKETDPQYQHAANLARDYVYGNPFTGFKGQKLEEPGAGAGPRGEWNDWEMYAGLASGVLGNLDLLPPYMHEFYKEMFAGTSRYEPTPYPYPWHTESREGPLLWPRWKGYERAMELGTGLRQRLLPPFGTGSRAKRPRGMTEQERQWRDEAEVVLRREYLERQRTRRGK